MALIDDVYQGASQAQAGPGHTVGSAMDAYKLASDTQIARQKLDMEKQQNEIGKAHAFIGQLDSLSRMTPAMQNVALKNLTSTWRSMYPDMSPDFQQALTQDKDFRAQTLQVASGALKTLREGGQLTAEGAAGINAVPGLSSTDLYNYVQQAQDAYSKRQQAAAMSGIKQTNKDNSDFEKLGEKVNNPTSRSTIGRYQQNLDKVETLKQFDTTLGLPPGERPPKNETLAQKIERYDKASPQDLFEVVKAADQLISNAQSTVYGADHLMPKDMGIAQAKIQQWITNGAAPADSGAFIAKFMNMAQREGQYYRAAKQHALKGMTSGYSHLEKKDPERFKAIVGDLDNPTGALDSPAAAAGGAAPPAGGGGGPLDFNAWKAAGKPGASK